MVIVKIIQNAEKYANFIHVTTVFLFLSEELVFFRRINRNVLYIIAVIKHPVAIILYVVLGPVVFINKPPPAVPALRPGKYN